jgi:predicted O-methyltransferase YrrM
MDTETIANFTPLPYLMNGWNGEDQIFGSIIAEVCPKVIIEVGTWMGMSACHMADLSPDSIIYCVDTWLGSTEFLTTMGGTHDRNLMKEHGYPQCYYQFLSNIIHRGCSNRIIPIPAPSEIAAEVLTYRGVVADLIYIDAGHSCNEVLRDIENYRPLLRNGGVMFGDDATTWPGVSEAAAKVGATIEGSKWVLRQ